MSETGFGADGARGIAKGSVLRRLLKARLDAAQQAGCPPLLPQPVPPTPARAAATAAGRAADRLYRLAVQPVEVTTGAMSLAEMPEMLPERALLVVLAGPAEALGVIALSPETVTALVEVQALGRITSRPVERRRPTRSDAMLCTDFINALLGELAQELSACDGFEGWQGYRYASHLDDPRPLLLMLEDRAFRNITMDLRLGGNDGREGRILVALPQPGPPDQPRASRQIEVAPDIAEPQPPDPTPDLRPDLTAVTRMAPIEVVAILCRRRISLGELRALAPGKTLPLPRVSLFDTRLETVSGQLLAHGKLGEVDGCHAIRLRGPGDAAQDAGIQAEAAAAASLRHHPPMDDLAQTDPFRDDADAARTPAPPKHEEPSRVLPE